ncbi:HAMP domain-containing protein [Candidatus Wolfebacteria bacterium]|nr:HAMP domain-containing protein [Candidatus Wolfebacteria bacterium]
MAILIVGLIFYLNSYFKNYFKNYTLDNFQNLVELSESSYFSFIKSLQTRTIDWSSDGYIRNTTEEILKASIKDRESLVKELNSYLKNEKIIYDPNVSIIDILDENGVVIASSRDNRIGVDEKKEELEFGNIKFIEAIKADFGQSFIAPIVSEEDEYTGPMIHITARIFSQKTYSNVFPVPLDAVMLVHFINTSQLRDVLIGNFQIGEERITNKLLSAYYKTIDIYLVNKNRLMITPPRFSEETILKQKVETEPIKACFERGEEIKSEYIDYRGQPVFGASMCIERDGVALILEAESQEVLAPLKNINQFFILIGGIILVLIVVGIILLSNWLLRGLKIITDVAEKISKGVINERVKINSKDEIGYLAKVFNEMLNSIEKSQKGLEEAEIQMKEINISLEQRINERTAELMELKVGLEKAVIERTSELKKKLEELEKFKKLTINRELKMIELKKEIENFKNK